MEDQLQGEDRTQIGDKVRIRSGIHAGVRGIVQAYAGDFLEIQLDEGELLPIMPEEITNYSLAARRAWRTMPKRAGRPQLSVPRKKMVSMRLDIDLWERLGEAVERGFIASREEAVNTWVQQQLDALFEKFDSNAQDA